MTDKILTGRDVAELLIANEGKDYMPAIEKRHPRNGEWCEARPWDWSLGDLLSTEYQFRIKPAPKPDVSFDLIVRQVYAYPEIHYPEHWEQANIRFTFDGEIGKLKKAEVL